MTYFVSYTNSTTEQLETYFYSTCVNRLVILEHAAHLDEKNREIVCDLSAGTVVFHYEGVQTYCLIFVSMTKKVKTEKSAICRIHGGEALFVVLSKVFFTAVTSESLDLVVCFQGG